MTGTWFKGSLFEPLNHGSRTISRGTPLLALTLLLSLFIIPGAMAEPPARQQAKDLGYSPDIFNDLPDKHFPRSPADPGVMRPEKKGGLKDLDTVKDFLTPRLYQRPEPTALLPTLLNLYQRQPQSSKITRKLALTCLQAGQPREALHWFIKTFQLDRNDLSALWNMATLAYRIGDYKQAADYFGEYVRIDPNSAWGNMARQFQSADRFESHNLSSGFRGVIPKLGFVEPSTSSQSGGSSMMVIDGRQMTPDEFLPIPVMTKKTARAESDSGKNSVDAEFSLLSDKKKPNINSAKIENSPPAGSNVSNTQPAQFTVAPPPTAAPVVVPLPVATPAPQTASPAQPVPGK